MTLTTRTDQRGTVRSFNYDKLGRVTDDRVTTNGTGTDVTVKRISGAYEVRGMVATLTSYDNATVGSGTALNQIAFTYNSFSQMIEEQQEHSGTVSGFTPSVQYTFSGGSFKANYAGFTQLTYPNGRQVNVLFGTSGDIDDCLNRIHALYDGGTLVILAQYTYLGMNSVVQIDYSEPGVQTLHPPIPPRSFTKIKFPITDLLVRCNGQPFQGG